MALVTSPRQSLWTDRPPNADHEWFAATPPPRSPQAPPPAPEPPRGRRRLAVALVGVALLFGGAATAIPLLDGEDESARSPRAAAPLPVSTGGAGESRVKEIYAAAAKGVVNVRVVGSGGTGGTGTGFLIDDEGTVVTNAHVVEGAQHAQVRADEARAPIDAEVIGADASTDLAVLRIDDTTGLTPLTLADSDAVGVGDTAVAIGYPLGLDRTVTAGIVSGLGRSIQAPNGFSIDEVIQTDAPINPGNSGGPLLDARARVIGVNSQIATAGGGGGNVGIGFAVPSNTVREIIPQLIGGSTIDRAYLGVSTSESLDGRGAVVREVTPGGPARDAGMRASTSPTGAGGDVIIAIEGSAVTGPQDVADAISSRAPGETVEVRVRRDGGELTIAVELGRRPQSAP